MCSTKSNESIAQISGNSKDAAAKAGSGDRRSLRERGGARDPSRIEHVSIFVLCVKPELLY